MKTKGLHNQLVEWRHQFHQNPELGFEEIFTSNKVIKILNEIGLEVHSELGKTGVVAVLKKGNSEKSLAIRADMDALPIEETNTFNYISKNTGCMHACGHDGHTSMLLGAARYLKESGNFSGTIYFIFQPNEENTLGAQAMIDDGLFKKFNIDEVYALHNIPGMELGSFAFKEGTITASENLFEITLEGVGGHAALPHMSKDTITIGSQIINALQTIISRKLNPADNGVVSVTEFISDGKKNVLPGRGIIRGDARALSDQANSLIETNIKQIAQGVGNAHDIKVEVLYKRNCPITINSPTQTKVATSTANNLVGEAKVDSKCEPKLFSEDFSIMSNYKPGCFVLMGNGTEGSNGKPLHSSDYDFNDDALVIGSSFWVQLVEDRLQ